MFKNCGSYRIRTYNPKFNKLSLCALKLRNHGGSEGTWTHNLLINSQVLYRLSYTPIYYILRSR